MQDGSNPTGVLPQDRWLSERLLGWVDRRRHWLIAALVVFYLAGFNGQWRIGPDTGLFATMGRHLAEGHGYVFPEVESLRRNPGLPVLLAVNIRLFGPETFWPVCLVMWGLGLASLALVYRLFRLHAGRPTAVLMVCLVGWARYAYVYAFELLTDLPFFVGLLLLLVGLEELEQRRGPRWRSALAIVLGVTVMAAFRSVVVIVLAALGVMVLWRLVRGPNRGRYLALGIAAVLCVLVVRATDPRLRGPVHLVPDERQAIDDLGNVKQTLQRVIHVNAPLLLNDVGPRGFFGCELAPGVNALATVGVLGLGIGLLRRRLLWGLLVAACTLQWLLFMPAPRYYLPVLPLLLFGWWQWACWCERRLPAPWGRRAFVSLVFLVAATNIIRTSKIIVWEQRRVPFLTHYKDGRFLGLAELGRAIRERTGAEALIILDDPKTVSGLAYYSGRRVVLPSDLPAGQDTSVEAVHTRLAGESEFYVAEPGGQELRRLVDSMPLRLDQTLATAPHHGGTVWELRRAHLGAVP